MSSQAPYSLPPVPQTNGLSVTVEDNIAKALAQTAGMTLAQKFEWFFAQVMPFGSMDYKNYADYKNSQAAQNFGNFNYGVVGTALGIPIEILDRFAGYAQVGADIFLDLKLPNAPWGSDFGDNPGDQAKINEGIAWAESNGYVDITNLSNNALGTEGDDVLWVSDGALGLLNLLNGVTLNGGSGNDFVVGSKGSDELQGGTGKDTLYGGGNDDFMFGDQGDDILHGGTGTDWLEGGEGNDTLEGGELVGVNADSSADTLIGGKGNDFLAGGDGNDTYIYNSGDGFDAIADLKAVRSNAPWLLRPVLFLDDAELHLASSRLSVSRLMLLQSMKYLRHWPVQRSLLPGQWFRY
ncbi:polymorphic toxin type 44 domain-containing protein [Methyloglobulus sp.]|uniref:calcium-binding protein n=1 Tax=Methyloglobulus sp. TaxID=2518622 RepID=UPI0032B83AC3